MAVREFLRDAPADDLITATGALSGMTHGTVGFIVKLLDVADFNDLFYLHDSGGTNIGGVGVDDSSTNVYWWDGSTNPGGPSLTANVWLLVVARKATGTATARFSVYNYSTDTWSHANASGTTGNFTAPGVSGDIRFSFESTFGLCELRIALRAAWSNSLPWSADTTGDSAIEAAGLETSAANWDAESPSMGQLFNQAATTTPVEDWTGGGADETTLTGTTVVNGDDPPGFDFSLSAGTPVGQASETDTAQPVTSAKTTTLGQPVETDTAQPVTTAKALTLAQTTETDTAQPITARKTHTIGQATETDQAQSVTSVGATPIGQAVETDTAQPITARKTITLGQPVETDAAQAVTLVVGTAVGQAVETDQAFAVTVLKTVTLGLAVETDLALALGDVGEAESVVTAQGTHSLVATAAGTYAATVAASGTHDLIVEAEGAL